MMSSVSSAKSRGSRAALKSGNLAEEIAENQINAPAHFFLEGGTGAITGFALAAGPGSILSLHGPAQDAQHGGRDRVMHPATVFPAADIQPIMGAILNAPILTGQFEQSRGVRLLWRQAGDQPDRFHFLPPVLQFANAIQARQLSDVRKTHLFGRDGCDFDAAPFEAAVSFVNLQ